jgi:hypothetical protein
MTPKTVKQVIDRHESGAAAPTREPHEHNYDEVHELVADRITKVARPDHREASAAGRACGRGMWVLRPTSGCWLRNKELPLPNGS